MTESQDYAKIFEVLKLYASSLEEKAKAIRTIRNNSEPLKKISSLLDIRKCANEMESELIHRSHCLSNYLRAFDKLSKNPNHKNIADVLRKRMFEYRSEFKTDIETCYKLCN